MFVIIVGGGRETVNLAHGLDDCPRCRSEQPHSLVLTYSFHHLYYLGFVYNERYLLSCNRCNSTVEKDGREIRRKLAEDPVPANRRYGCLLAIAFVLALIGMSMFFRD